MWLYKSRSEFGQLAKSVYGLCLYPLAQPAIFFNAAARVLKKRRHKSSNPLVQLQCLAGEFFSYLGAGLFFTAAALWSIPIVLCMTVIATLLSPLCLTANLLANHNRKQGTLPQSRQGRIVQVQIERSRWDNLESVAMLNLSMSLGLTLLAMYLIKPIFNFCFIDPDPGQRHGPICLRNADLHGEIWIYPDVGEHHKNIPVHKHLFNYLGRSISCSLLLIALPLGIAGAAISLALSPFLLLVGAASWVYDRIKTPNALWRIDQKLDTVRAHARKALRTQLSQLDDKLEPLKRLIANHVYTQITTPLNLWRVKFLGDKQLKSDANIDITLMDELIEGFITKAMTEVTNTLPRVDQTKLASQPRPFINAIKAAGKDVFPTKIKTINGKPVTRLEHDSALSRLLPRAKK